MRVVATERKIESTFTGRKKKFRIEASAKAFQILSSNLYTDKPLAILRELSCNALDAHRDAGTLDRPFEISMPSRVNPTLHFRDYGTGMSDEKVYGLYSTVFASDKTDSDLDIGGLGLGSKTPFSYSDTFTLITYLNGVKTIWLCYIDDDGEPAVQIAEKDDTDEPNGVEYQIPVKFEDFNAFREKVSRALCYFPPESYKTSQTVYPITYKMKNEMYGMREANHLNGLPSGPLVLMGPVAYKLDKAAFDIEDQRKYTMVLDHNFDIFCEIGEIDFQASREALSYDTKSKKKILAILDKVVNALRGDIEQKIKEAPTYLEACSSARDLMSSFHYSQRDGLKWRGKDCFPDTSLSLKGEAAIVTVNDITAADHLRPGFSSHLYLTLETLLKNPIMVHYDLTCPQNNLRVKQYLRDGAQLLLMFKNEQDMLRIMYEYEIWDSLSTWDLPIPERAKNASGRVSSKAPVKIKIAKAGSSCFYESSMTVDEINATGQSCWAPLFGSGDAPWSDEADKIKHSFITHRVGHNFTVFGVPKTLLHKAKFFTIPTLEEYTRGYLIEYMDYDEVMNAVLNSKVDWGYTLYSNFPSRLQHLPVFQMLDKHYAQKVLWVKQYKEQMASMFDWTFPQCPDNDSAMDNLLEDKYRMTRHLDNMWRANTDEYINEVLDLIHPDGV